MAPFAPDKSTQELVEELRVICQHNHKLFMTVDAERNRLRDINAELLAALEVCDRVLHFDLHKMITWGPDCNQAVKDAADQARATIAKAEGRS